MTHTHYASQSIDSHASSTSLPPCILDLDQLRDRCLGNEQLVERILDKLEQTLAEEMQGIHAALLQSNYSSLATIAHRLKGTAANVGAEALREMAQQLETFARREQVAETQICFEMLQQERQRLLDVMSARHE